MAPSSLQARKGAGSWETKYHSWRTTHAYHQIHRRRISHLFIKPFSSKFSRSLVNRTQGTQIGVGCTSFGRTMWKIVAMMIVRDVRSTGVEKHRSWYCL